MSIEESAIGVIAKVEKDPADQKYYVYYNEYTGAISAVTTVPHIYITDPELVVTLQDTDAPKEIIAGRKSVADFIVAYDDKDELSVQGKGDVLRWTRRSSKLVNVPIQFEQKKDDVFDLDVRFVYHVRDDIVRLVVTDKIRQRIANPLGNRQFRIASGHKLALFITDANDPDFIHDTIEFPLEDLIRHQELIIENFSLKIGKNTGLWTSDNFQSYRFDVVQQRYVKSRYDDDVKSRISTVLQSDEESHIQITPLEENHLQITNRIKNMNEVKFFEPEFKLYVCNDDPDNYEGQLTFSMNDLEVDRPKTFKIPIDIRDKTLLYSGNRITVTLRG